jgi:hypothetical protein
VHPDGGKWLIAAGEQIFGMTPFGWRVSAAIAGALTVLILCRLVRRMTGSTLLGCVAGLLLATDGLHLVVSRLALLDIFVGLWVVCAVACLVADRDWARAGSPRRPPRTYADGGRYADCWSGRGGSRRVPASARRAAPSGAASTHLPRSRCCRGRGTPGPAARWAYGSPGCAQLSSTGCQPS